MGLLSKIKGRLRHSGTQADTSYLDEYPTELDDCICWPCDFSGYSVCGVPCSVHQAEGNDLVATDKGADDE